LENVNIEQPANYASRDSSFIGFSNISLHEQSRLYIKGENCRVHVDAQIAGIPDSLSIENADLSNSHAVAFMRIGGGEIVLTNCDMNDAENFGDLSTFRFTDSNVYFTDFSCVGGISDSSTVELLNSNAVFEDSRILSNSSLFGVGGVYFKSLADHVLTLRGLELRDNEAEDQAKPSNANIQGGDLDTSDPRGASFICESLNCLFSAPQVMIDVTSRPDRTIYSIQNCSFRGGSAYISSIDNGLLPEGCAMRNVIIDNCHVIANQAGGTLEHVTITSTGQLETDSAVPFTARRSILMCDTNGMVLPADGHNWTSSHGDPRLAASGEPKWNSPCLDRLNDELDFDLTAGDLGWKPVLSVASITGQQGNRLSRANYLVTGHTLINGSIEPGSTFKVASGKQLLFRATPDADNTRRIGSLDGPRTAIVARTERNGDPASSISIQNWTGSSDAKLLLEGVLFNYPPRGASSMVSFYGWKPSSGGILPIDSAHVEFQNFINARHDAMNERYNGGLQMQDCNTRVSGFHFGNADSTQAAAPAYLYLMGTGRMDVDSCLFEQTTTGTSSNQPCLVLTDQVSATTSTLQGNTFLTSTGSGSSSRPLMTVTNSVARLRENSFENCLVTPLVMDHSTLHADRGARNSWSQLAGEFEDDSSLVWMKGGFLDLYCGQNNFIAAAFDTTTWPIIKWTAGLDSIPESTSWRENYWGRTCALPVSQSLLDAGLLPLWAVAEDNLTTCVTAMTPANPLCPYEESTPQELLQNGITAEKLGTPGLAHDHYRALLGLWAAKKEANEGTLRLKALGLDKYYGPESYELVRDDLFVAAESSAAAKLFYQVVLQRCSGWCVEAHWGDRPLAISSLNTLLAGEQDRLNRDTIHRALLEISTYPPQGGLQAMDDEAIFAQALAQQAAAAALMNFKGGQDIALVERAVERPKVFEITRVYPNPFNACVTLELAFPCDGQAQVRVVNLLGQVVHTVLDRPVTAGFVRATVDASRWSSGLYFVVAEQGGQTVIRKMTLIK